MILVGQMLLQGYGCSTDPSLGRAWLQKGKAAEEAAAAAISEGGPTAPRCAAGSTGSGSALAIQCNQQQAS